MTPWTSGLLPLGSGPVRPDRRGHEFRVFLGLRAVLAASKYAERGCRAERVSEPGIPVDGPHDGPPRAKSTLVTGALTNRREAQAPVHAGSPGIVGVHVEQRRLTSGGQHASHHLGDKR